MKKSYFFLFLLLFSCESAEFYKKYEDIAQVKWQKTQPISFEVNMTDTVTPFDWIISLRHTSSIQNGDIKVLLEAHSPSGKLVSQEYLLAIRNRQTGDLLGSAMGDMCDTDNTVEKKFVFGEIGNYTFKITPQTEDALPVLEVGFILRKDSIK